MEPPRGTEVDRTVTAHDQRAPDDLVKRLRAIDHMNVEECFLDSYLYAKAADRIEELERQLADRKRPWCGEAP
jgi:hypothetical protein